MLKAIRERFIPNKVFILRPTEVESPEIVRLATYTRDMSSMQGKATAYVCQNYSCKQPTTDIGKFTVYILDLILNDRNWAFI